MSHPMSVRTPIAAFQVLTLYSPDRSHVRQAETACLGGAKWIQLRAKGLALPEWIRLAAQVVSVCRTHDAVCVVNDSVWVALASGADGVHLGREDISAPEARRILGPQKIVGVTVNFPEDAARVIREGVADYAGVGPWRHTVTKQKLAPVLSPETLRTLLATLAPMPCVVIGGVTASDIPAILDLGAHGVAVSSAVVTAPEPDRATREFIEALS